MTNNSNGKGKCCDCSIITTPCYQNESLCKKTYCLKNTEKYYKSITIPCYEKERDGRARKHTSQINIICYMRERQREKCQDKNYMSEREIISGQENSTA